MKYFFRFYHGWDFVFYTIHNPISGGGEMGSLPSENEASSRVFWIRKFFMGKVLSIYFILKYCLYSIFSKKLPMLWALNNNLRHSVNGKHHQFAFNIACTMRAKVKSLRVLLGTDRVYLIFRVYVTLSYVTMLVKLLLCIYRKNALGI